LGGTNKTPGARFVVGMAVWLNGGGGGGVEKTLGQQVFCVSPWAARRGGGRKKKTGGVRGGPEIFLPPGLLEKKKTHLSQGSSFCFRPGPGGGGPPYSHHKRGGGGFFGGIHTEDLQKGGAREKTKLMGGFREVTGLGFFFWSKGFMGELWGVGKGWAGGGEGGEGKLWGGGPGTRFFSLLIGARRGGAPGKGGGAEKNSAKKKKKPVRGVSGAPEPGGGGTSFSGPPGLVVKPGFGERSSAPTFRGASKNPFFPGPPGKGGGGGGPKGPRGVGKELGPRW